MFFSISVLQANMCLKVFVNKPKNVRNTNFVAQFLFIVLEKNFPSNMWWMKNSISHFPSIMIYVWKLFFQQEFYFVFVWRFFFFFNFLKIKVFPQQGRLKHEFGWITILTCACSLCCVAEKNASIGQKLWDKSDNKVSNSKWFR